MDPVCLICGDVAGPFEKNHLGAKLLWPDLWYWFCIPCHRVFTKHQMNLGIIRPGPRDGRWTEPRSDEGRRWGLFEGAMVALTMATASCERCRAELSPVLIAMSQAAGVAVNRFEPDSAHPPRTDSVGAARRGKLDPRPGEAHEVRLVHMLADVGLALGTGIESLPSLTRVEPGEIDADGTPWLEEFEEPMMEVLQAVFEAEGAEQIEQAMAEALPLQRAMTARLQGILARM